MALKHLNTQMAPKPYLLEVKKREKRRKEKRRKERRPNDEHRKSNNIPYLRLSLIFFGQHKDGIIEKQRLFL